jgi:hypothetical protein
MALAAAFALLFSCTRQSFAADCSVITDTLARLRCWNRAADARLPRPKAAAPSTQQTREQQIRKAGGEVSR